MAKTVRPKVTSKKKPWNVTDTRFVCFLDIMGFKDMVMRNTHDEIYTILDELSKHRSSLEYAEVPDYESDALKTVSFSDTIVVFTKDHSKESLELLTFAVSWLFAKAMQSGIPLKGAISCGDMSVNISRQIFFGQPLIDAYLLEEDVAFYGIAIHNTVERFLNIHLNNLLGKERYIDCLIPLKSGKISHYILDWVLGLDDNDDISQKDQALQLMRKQRENTAGGPRKYIDNTIDIINHIYK